MEIQQNGEILSKAILRLTIFLSVSFGSDGGSQITTNNSEQSETEGIVIKENNYFEYAHGIEWILQKISKDFSS